MNYFISSDNSCLSEIDLVYKFQFWITPNKSYNAIKQKFIGTDLKDI